MKKIFSILLLSMILMLSACSKEDATEKVSAKEVKDRVHYYSISEVKEGIQASIDSKYNSDR